jgi:hypothetical protein
MVIGDQLELSLPQPRADLVAPEEIAEMIAFLNGQDWVKARLFPVGWTERRIRAVASASKGRVISGQQGYKLTLQATIDEVTKARNWLLGQAEEMRRRVAEIDRVYHGRRS